LVYLSESKSTGNTKDPSESFTYGAGPKPSLGEAIQYPLCAPNARSVKRCGRDCFQLDAFDEYLEANELELGFTQRATLFWRAPLITLQPTFSKRLRICIKRWICETTASKDFSLFDLGAGKTLLPLISVEI
jgi:hypothetical protein